MVDQVPTHDVKIPAGGWGSAKATLSILHQEHSTFPAGKAILRQNKHDGFTCVSCSWAKPAHPHSVEACENGIKATAWELTSKRTPPEFFAAHTVTELLDYPLSVPQMALGLETQISTQYHQVRIGGDIAAITGICKSLLEADERAVAAGQPRVLDVEFIEQHTHGLEEFAHYVRACSWDEIESESGLRRAALEEAANEYAQANRVMAIYGMGLTQHRRGVEAVQMLTNMLLLRGNMGKFGAGICPVRGHSNVQGQRTVGITEKPELAPLDKLEQRYGFTAPRTKGLNTVETCKGVIEGRVKAFLGLGGNFVRAVPETDRIEAAWGSLELTVQIATKLNRSHVVHGKTAYLLPCLGRIEVDEQLSGAQSVTTEDSTGVMHPSTGVADPASPHLLSETAIVAGIAKTTLPANPALPWDRWVADYSLIRDEIAAIYPDIFHDFNERRQVLGGFRRPVPASVRVWKTPNGKANFIRPEGLIEDPDIATPPDPEILRLMTMRSDDQFNTTVYTLNDRFRGIEGTRRVILMNPADLAQLGFADGDMVNVFTAVDDGVVRVVRQMKITAFDIPAGCLAGYYPECNPLVPLWHHAKDSFVPAAKSIPVRLVKAASS